MRATVIKAAAGSGKTFRALSKIASSRHTPFEIYAPTHKLAEESRDTIQRLNPSKRVIVIRGRSHEEKPGKPLCKKSKQAEQLSAAGFPIFENLCRQPQGQGKPSIKCPHFDTCEYINQYSNADVYIYTHAHLPLKRGPLETWQPYGVVIDESFFLSCIAKAELNLAVLSHPGIPPAAQQLCREIAQELPRKGRLHSVLQLAGTAGRGLSPILSSLASVKPTFVPGMTKRQFDAALKSGVNFSPIIELIKHLEAEFAFRSNTHAMDFDPQSGDITLHHRRPIDRFERVDGPQPRILILDASASRRVIEQYFQIDKFIDDQVSRGARVIQCSSTRCSTTSLVPAQNSNGKSKDAAESRLQELEALIHRLAVGGRKVLVVGPAAVVGNSKTGTPALLTVPPHCELAHFKALRGIDRWKSFDVVIVVGRHQPPVEAVEDIARALYFDSHQTLKLTGNLTVQPRGYRMVNRRFGTDVLVHVDPRVQDVMEQVREHESTQAIDRLRLVHNTDPKLVIILSNIALDIDIDETMTWEEIMAGGSRLDRAWDAMNGTLPLNAAWLHARYPKLWTSAGAARQDVLVARKRAGFSNIGSIRKTSSFEHEYKAGHQRAWSKCVSCHSEPAKVKGDLEVALGQSVTMRT